MNEPKNKNASYETENETPSSGSGSSLGGENNDDLEMVPVGNIKLPRLLEPNYKYERQQSIEALRNEENLKSCRKNIIAPLSNYKSSQESPFFGFRETPLKLIKQQKFIYPESTEEDSTDYEDDGVVYLMQKFPSNPKLNEQTANKEIFETIVIENSCNAVDMPLTSQEKDDVEEFAAPLVQPQISDLSFNGKIKGLNINCENEIKQKEVLLTSNNKINNETINESTTIDLCTTNQFSQSFYKYAASPDLFAADDDDDDAENDNLNSKTEVSFEKEATEMQQDVSFKEEPMDVSFNRSSNCPTESSYAEEPTCDGTTQNESDFKRLFRENCRREKELLRRTRKCLSGVPPPPSLTIPQLDLMELVIGRKEDIFSFHKNSFDNNNEEQCKSKQRLSVLKPTHSLEVAKNMPWRDILGVRQHGFSYNLSNDSENSEYLSLSVVERFVGAETTSSYRRSPSSAKKHNTRLKLLTQSPGNRLSHLAKRRAIFSSANLATTSQKSTTSLGPQIVIDKKKSKNRRKTTPKRKTPGSKKKARKTPTSSTKKQQFPTNLIKPGPSRETSKRALFQSPLERQQQPLKIIKPQIKPEIATKVEKSKRALFSPDNTTPTEDLTFLKVATKQLMETSLLKRKRYDSQNDLLAADGLDMPSKKILKTDSSCLTPRALKIKSQSFCIGAGSSLHSTTATMSSSTTMRQKLVATNSSTSFLSLSSAASSSSLLSSHGGSNNYLNEPMKLQRAHSEYVAPPTSSLTDNQKKKLLWAVSQALQEKKITTKHENFKQFASVLARVVRRIFQEFYQRTSTSNSETLLRLAKKYVFYVISGRNADDVYLQVKSQIEESKRLSTNRLTGYIGPEEYQQRKKQLSQLSQSSSYLSSSMSLCGSLQNLFSNDNSNLGGGACSQQLGQSSTQIQLDSNFSKYWPTTVSSEDLNKAAATTTTTKIATATITTNLTKSNSKQQQQQRSIEINPNLQNSSSKSNLGSLALRENSGQKNFTGKDQRNVSPYAKNNSGLKLSTTNLNSTDALHAVNSAKAKRQIFFDS